ncbi:MAG: HDOD domain-containing protein [Phycisphaeraceae bacterium]|nr:MAG: HDOD domain-containing protein [Phycisphaeraceae bacterium]
MRVTQPETRQDGQQGDAAISKIASRPDPVRLQRVELILQQIESLPTLSPIAQRLLRLSSSENADIREIVALVEADAALTGRLLAMCRRVSTGLGDSITTVERAVVMLGFEAVRSALLSVHLHDLLSGKGIDEVDGAESAGAGSASTIDRRGLWRHSLAVACAAELIAEHARPKLATVKPDEAFVCGLLHDLGKHALDAVIPKTYACVAQIADHRQVGIAEVERSVIGVDHHGAGKRLGEHWGLPHALLDVIWLHGQSRELLPELQHWRLIGVVSIADAMARQLHLGWSGNCAPLPDVEKLCAEWEIDPGAIERIQQQLHERVAARTRDLGLDELQDADLAIESVLEANRRLGSLNTALQERSRLAAQQARALEAVVAFHTGKSEARTLVRAFMDVTRSAAGLFGDGFYAIAYQQRPGAAWHLCNCEASGRVLRHVMADPVPGAEDLAILAENPQLGAANVDLFNWLAEQLGDLNDVRRLRLMPLIAGADRPAFLIHDREIDSALVRGPALEAVRATWASAIAAAAQHDGARRLGEQLADANRRLVDAQGKLTEARSMARLGELASGAAHEMNNPLTVIRGRSQLLAGRLSDADLKRAASSISDAAEKLSDLISSLHLFASPPKPVYRSTDIPDLLSRVIRDMKLSLAERTGAAPPVRLVVQGPIPPVWVDPDQLGAVLTELLKNACEARPHGLIELRAHIEDEDGRLVIVVKDDGCGMSQHALQHAFDPFFSEKPAGRQTGLGLARARRLVDLHGGRIELESERGRGTTARILIDQWREPQPVEHTEKQAA